MKVSKVRMGAVVASVILAGMSCGASASAGSGLRPIRGTPVVAFYYPWYGTPQVSGYWRHWNNDGDNPDIRNPKTGFRQINSIYYPYPDGPYDSNDPAVLRRQLTEAEDAGINVFAVSWWGRNTFEDKAFAKLMSVAAQGHFDVRFTVYYEEVPDSDPADAISDFDYILGKYGKMPSFFRVGGRPVVLVYSRAIFPGTFCLFGGCPANSPPVIDWAPINKVLHSKFHAIVYGDESTTLLDVTPELAQMGFDGLHIYNPQEDLKFETPSEIYSKLADRASAHHMLVADTVIPGYNDTELGRKYPSDVPRDNGALYTSLWKAARAAKPDMFLITSFNEWHESTAIEPSFQWRDLYLDLTGEFSHSHP